jgi:hypothetical protein
LEAGQVIIIDTDQARADSLAAALCERFGQGRATSGSSIAGAFAVADGIVNATPLGMANYPGMAFPADLLCPIGDGTAAPGSGAGLPNNVWRWDGGFSGHRCLPAIHRPRAGRDAHAPSFQRDVILKLYALLLPK